MAVVISWEVFFGGRANEGVEHGGTFIINPTNGSSYTWTMLQTQQIASSRLRAVEQGRWLAQAAPTGFSAFITPSGDVIGRTGISEARVLSHVVVERTGRTWYSRLGNKPVVAVFVVVLLGARLAPGRARRRVRAGPDEIVANRAPAAGKMLRWGANRTPS
jgi:apolipoprotein N-acyltransferase